MISGWVTSCRASIRGHALFPPTPKRGIFFHTELDVIVEQTSGIHETTITGFEGVVFSYAVEADSCHSRGSLLGAIFF